MQPYKLHKKFILYEKLYQNSGIDESEYSPIVYERLEKLKLFDKLRSEGCSLQTAFSALQVPRSTLYRWNSDYKKFGLTDLEKGNNRPNNARKTNWKQSSVQQILYLRKQILSTVRLR